MNSEVTSEFIGREHELSWLKVAWTQARRGRPQLCVLRGESGFGKTRIVQAFYSWLSGSQDPQGYWPDVLLKEDKNLQLNPPPSSFGAAVTLPWLWWGVRWSNPDIYNRGELSTCALIDGLNHLEPHREALSARREAFKRGGKVMVELASVAGELLSFGVLGSVKSFADLSLLWREERHIREREKLSVEERQTTALQAQVDGLYEFLRNVVEPSAVNPGGLPLLLILDDAHWIDARSLQLVDRLLVGADRKGWPLMVIVTHWERDWNLQEQDSTRRSFPALYARLTKDLLQGEHSLSVGLRDIDRLDGLERLLLKGLPGLTTQQVAFLSDRADGNPLLMNEIILCLRDEPAYFEQERIDRPLSADGLAALSQKSFALHHLQEDRFRKLDEALKKILSYAGYQGMRFLRQLVLDVAQILDASHTSEDDADRLSRAVQPYAILAADSTVIYEFRHRVFHDLARERITRLPQLGRSLSKALLQVAGAWLERDQIESLTPAERESFYVLMLEQLESTDATVPHLRLRLIAGLFRLYHETGYVAKALEWSDRLASELPADGRIATEVLSLPDQHDIIYLWLDLVRNRPSEILARGLFETCHAKLEQSASDADRLGDLAAAEVCLGDVMLACDKPEHAQELFEKSLVISERLLTEFGVTVERLRYVAVSQNRVGDVLRRADQPERALELYRKALASYERISAEFGETAGRLRDVAVSQLRIGDVLWRADRPEEARAFHEKSLAIRERILTEFGETAERLSDVAVSQERVGDVLLRADEPKHAHELYKKSLALRERIVTEFGETARRLRDVSLSQGRVADVLLHADQPGQALELYKKSLAVDQRVLTEFGETAQRLRDVAISQERVGQALLRAGQREQVRELFENSLVISERILSEFGETAERLRDVAISRGTVGDLLLQADELEKARELYEKSLLAFEHISATFGETASRLSDVADSQLRIGDVFRSGEQLEQALNFYEKSLAMRERVLAEFGETADRLSDVAISQVKVGTLLLRANRQEPARELFENSLAIRERILTEFGETAERLSHFAVSHEAVGDALMRADQSGQALELYKNALAIHEHILDEFGKTPERLRGVSQSQERVGDALLGCNQPDQARACYEQALATSERILTDFGETAERLIGAAALMQTLGICFRHAGQDALARQRLTACESLITRAAAKRATPSVQAVLDRVRAMIAELG
jgi:tetratricopeptide (TPR) repeat protein